MRYIVTWSYTFFKSSHKTFVFRESLHLLTKCFRSPEKLLLSFAKLLFSLKSFSFSQENCAFIRKTVVIAHKTFAFSQQISAFVCKTVFAHKTFAFSWNFCIHAQNCCFHLKKHLRCAAKIWGHLQNFFVLPGNLCINSQSLLHSSEKFFCKTVFACKDTIACKNFAFYWETLCSLTKLSHSPKKLSLIRKTCFRSKKKKNVLWRETFRLLAKHLRSPEKPFFEFSVNAKFLEGTECLW